VKTKVNRKTKLRRCKYMPHFNNTVWALSSTWNTTWPLFGQQAICFRPIATNICWAWVLQVNSEKTVTFNSNRSPVDRIYCFETAGGGMRNLQETKSCWMPHNWEVNKEPRTRWLVMYSVPVSSCSLSDRHAPFACCNSYYLPCLTMLYHLHLL